MAIRRLTITSVEYVVLSWVSPLDLFQQTIRSNLEQKGSDASLFAIYLIMAADINQYDFFSTDYDFQRNTVTEVDRYRMQR